MSDKISKEQWSEWHKLLDGAADECLTAHANDVQQAAILMKARVRSDPRLREAMLEILVGEACHDRVRRRLQIRNQALWHQKEEVDFGQRGARLKRAAITSRKFKLLEYSLMGGIPLGTATRKQVLENANFQDRQARRMSQPSLWLALIADQMVDDKQIVRDIFNEDELRHLQTVAIGGGEAKKAETTE